MFIHHVTITRLNTSADFFYSAMNVLSNPAYIAMLDTAVQDGRVLNQSLEVSVDDLTLDREITWSSEESFNEFFSAYTANVFPNYAEDFDAYNSIHNHQAFLITETT